MNTLTSRRLLNACVFELQRCRANLAWANRAKEAQGAWLSRVKAAKRALGAAIAEVEQALAAKHLRVSYSLEGTKWLLALAYRGQVRNIALRGQLGKAIKLIAAWVGATSVSAVHISAASWYGALWIKPQAG